MTTPTNPDRLVDPRLVVRPDRRLIRAHGPQRAVPARRRHRAHRRAGPVAAPPARQPRLRPGPLRLDGRPQQALARQAGRARVDPPPRGRGPLRRRHLRRRGRRRHARHHGVARRPGARRPGAWRPIEPRSSTDLHAGWLTGCEQVAAGLAGGRRQPRPAAHGRPRQPRRDRPGGARPARLRPAPAGHRPPARSAWARTSTRRCSRSWPTTAAGTSTSPATWPQMRDHITSEVGETLEIVAREVVLELTLPGLRAGRRRCRRSAWSREAAAPGSCLGDMVSGQVLTIVLRLTFDFGDGGPRGGARAPRRGPRRRVRAGQPRAWSPASLAWTYADHGANDAQPRDVEVDRVVARLFAERAKQDAVRLNREGRYDDARRALDGVRERVGGYAGSDRRAPRARRRALRGAGPLRGADAGDGPQGRPLRVQQRVPDADAGREVPPGLTAAEPAAHDPADQPSAGSAGPAAPSPARRDVRPQLAP